MSSDPILIVGAGPTGLVLAIWLKTLSPSIRFKIVSDGKGVVDTSRAIVVHARTLELYRILGIADTIIAAGNVIKHVQISRHGKRRSYLNFNQIGKHVSKYPFVLALPQSTHERLLLKHLESLGGVVQWEHEARDFQQHDDHVLVEINGTWERFSYVAGCDGSHSAVRKKGGFEMTGGTYLQRFFVTEVWTPPEQTISGINLSPSREAMVVTLPFREPGHFILSGSYTHRSQSENDTFENVRDLVRRSTQLDVQKVDWFSHYNVHYRCAQTFRHKRLFIVGDAAHVHSPVGGQGLNCGVGDASNLAWKLSSVAAGTTSAELLDTYEPERIEFARQLVSTTDKAFNHMTSKHWDGWFMRNVFMPYILPLLWAIPFLRPKYFRTVSQLIIQYRGSPLSQGESGVLKAGDRLPFIEFGEEDNHKSHGLVRWQFHVYGGSPVESNWEDIPVYTYPLTQAGEREGLREGKVYLVRPDMYVGLIADGFGDPTLKAYVARWML